MEFFYPRQPGPAEADLMLLPAGSRVYAGWAYAMGLAIRDPTKGNDEDAPRIYRGGRAVLYIVELPEEVHAFTSMFVLGEDTPVVRMIEIDMDEFRMRETHERLSGKYDEGLRALLYMRAPKPSDALWETAKTSAPAPGTALTVAAHIRAGLHRFLTGKEPTREELLGDKKQK